MKIANFWLITSVILISFKKLQCKAPKCKEGQRERNDVGIFICCWTVICQYQSFEQCRVDGESDKCSECTADKYGKYIINTSNFEYPPTDACESLKDVCDTSNVGGTLLYFDGRTPECRCDRRRGYIRFNPQSLGCEQSGIICHNETTWLNDKGECEACGPNHIQDEVYGICYPELPRTYSRYTSTSTKEAAVSTIKPSPAFALDTEGIVGLTSASIIVFVFVVVAVLAFKCLNGREYILLRRNVNGNVPNGNVQVHFNTQLGRTEVEQTDLPASAAQGNDTNDIPATSVDSSRTVQENQSFSVQNEVDPEVGATSASRITPAASPLQNQFSDEGASERQSDDIDEHQNYRENQLDCHEDDNSSDNDTNTD